MFQDMKKFTQVRLAVDDALYNFDDKKEKRAKSLGCTIVYPAPNEIQLDIDSEDAYNHFTRMHCMLERSYSMYRREGTAPTIVRNEPSKSGLPNRHITVRFDHELEEWERLTLQIILGSDIKREVLSVIRILFQLEDKPSCLFEVAGSKETDAGSTSAAEDECYFVMGDDHV